MPTIEFDTMKYLAAHGHMPRGVGSWAFCPNVWYKSPNYLEHTFWVHGRRYADAKAQARVYFRMRGHRWIIVCS